MAGSNREDQMLGVVIPTPRHPTPGLGNDGKEINLPGSYKCFQHTFEEA